MATDENGNWKPDDPGFTKIELNDLEEVKRECSSQKRRIYFDNCAGCHMRVALHCPDCEVQISGCLCTEMERHGIEIAAERMRQRGLVLPNDLH